MHQLSAAAEATGIILIYHISSPLSLSLSLVSSDHLFKINKKSKMMTSSSISAHDLLDHPFPSIQLVTPTDHHDHGGHYYSQNWISHHHHQLDQHDQDRVESDDGLKQVMDMENGIEAWAWEQKDDVNDPTTGADLDSDDIHDNWAPSSKLRVVKKMSPKRASTANSMPVVENTDDFPYFLPENDSSSNNSESNGNNNGIRVCSSCNTTKTPLWRSGPRGPKSLCNACGIRQRKARRALAAAAAAAGSENDAVTKATATSSKCLKIKISNTKDKKTSITCHDSKQGWRQPYKKRLKQAQSPYTSASQDSNPPCGKDADDQCAGERNNNKGICFEEFITISLSKNAALHRVFPQDEKEAAILLMALSCGLVHN